MNLEQELREALRRKRAPEGFAGRVLARTRRRPIAWIWSGAIAASLLVGAAGLEYRRQQEEGRLAKDQLLWALGLAGHKIEEAQNKAMEAIERQ